MVDCGDIVLYIDSDLEHLTTILARILQLEQCNVCYGYTVMIYILFLENMLAKYKYKYKK